MKGPQDGGGRDDVGSVPASVPGTGRGMSPHVRKQLGEVARVCVQAAEGGELTGAALSLLSDLAALGVRSGSVSA